MSKFDNFVSLDLDKMAEDDNRFGRGKRIQRLKVQVGQPRVFRILRGPTESSFYRIRGQHWGIPVGHGNNNPPLACAKKHGEGLPCYFCEQVNEYFNSGDPRQAELARRMKTSVSVISNVIDVKDPLNEDGTPKVLIWQYSWKLFQEVRSYFRDADYGDLTHPESGRNFKINASLVSSAGDKGWTRYDLQIGAKPTELEVPEALSHLYDLDNTFPVKLYTYEEQQLIWDGSWDPRNSRPSLPLPVAPATAHLETKEEPPDDDDFVDSSVTATAVPKYAKSDDDEFETQEKDEWDDILSDDSDSDKQIEMKKKLDALKNAAKR